MGVNDEGMHYVVRLGTEDMLTQLRARVDAGDASSATTRRITGLERELHLFPGVTSEQRGSRSARGAVRVGRVRRLETAGRLTGLRGDRGRRAGDPLARFSEVAAVLG